MRLLPRPHDEEHCEGCREQQGGHAEGGVAEDAELEAQRRGRRWLWRREGLRV